MASSQAHLYSLTLQRSSAVVNAIYGNFSDPNAHEIICARGKSLELLRPDENGKVQSILSVEIFGVIRSLATFRLTGGSFDYIVVGSDSGRVVVLQYKADTNRFEKVHEETYGKTGCRRIEPGQYVAVDPQGRAIMLGAIEKRKVTYVMNRDAEARLTISSPLEANKSHFILHDVVGIDVGFENPMFACLEVDYSDADEDSTGEALQETEKVLTYYELDLGLNHVVKMDSTPVARSANKLIAVPGGGDGPGGVLICSEDHITYQNLQHDKITVPFPRRASVPEGRTTLIVASSTHKQKGFFFFLLQSEFGDIYKATMESHEDLVTDLKVKYFDTIPTANSICITRSGLLFSASEFGDHALYKFAGIGDDSDKTAESSKSADTKVAPTFMPRPLTNLMKLDTLPSLAPMTDILVDDLAKEDTPQIYSVCGRGPGSSLRVLRHGLPVVEYVETSMPGNPSAVWTVKKQNDDEFDSYIVVSFINATLILSIGETVDEVKDSGFDGEQRTLAVHLMEDDSIIQVHPFGIRQIHTSRNPVEWKPPGQQKITHATANNKQVVVALSDGDLIYFEMDRRSGQLEERMHKKDVGFSVSCLDLGAVPEGRLRFPYAVVGDNDKAMRMLSLDQSNLLEQVGVQALPTEPESIAIMAMESNTGGSQLFVHVGLRNGVMVRTQADSTTGQFNETRSRFMGSMPVKMHKVTVHGKPALLALSSRSWLCYNFQSRFYMTPLSYDRLSYASNFCSEQCEEGIVAVAKDTLRIVQIEKLGEEFNQQKLPLRYTPRKMTVHPLTSALITIETDHNTVSVERGGEAPAAMAAAADANQKASSNGKAGMGDEDEDSDDEDDENETPQQVAARVGRPKPATAGHWASCIRMLSMQDGPLHLEELPENEAAFSVTCAAFPNSAFGADEVFVIVGTVRGMTMHPRRHKGCAIRVYRVMGGKTLNLMHTTDVEDVPLAMSAFKGYLAVSVGSTLRLYDMGKKKLLRKCENKRFPTLINSIQTHGDRLYVGDLAESFHFVKYQSGTNQLVIFADDIIPRYLTSSTFVDHSTVAGGDKFGNIFLLRLPAGVNDDISDSSGGGLFWDAGKASSGAPNKLENIAQFHVGEVVTQIRKASLIPGGQEALIYSTIMGSVGVLLPFTSRVDVDFFAQLEMHMRSTAPPLCGRDHMAYRSYFIPVKDVIDGDFCEQFRFLSPEKQEEIAEQLDRSPAEIIKKLEICRNKLM